jgi:hypothetical protein
LKEEKRKKKRTDRRRKQLDEALEAVEEELRKTLISLETQKEEEDAKKEA